MQELDTLSKYGQSFQSKVLSALLVDGKFLDTISEITTAIELKLYAIAVMATVVTAM